MSTGSEEETHVSEQDAPEMNSEEAVSPEEVPVEVTDPADETPEDPTQKLETELAKWKDLALRNQAELDNFRKRMAREKSDAIRYANSSLLESLLPVIDNFNYGLEAARQEGEGSVVYQGISMVAKQLEDFLQDNGVQEIAAQGQPFDPNVHEAVEQQFNAEVPEGQVIFVLRKGYRLSDRLLRAANVVVSRGPEPPAEEAPAD